VRLSLIDQSYLRFAALTQRVAEARYQFQAPRATTDNNNMM
jgi:hypothetical protein